MEAFRTLVLAALVAAPLAGCLDAFPLYDGPSDEASALTLLPVARAKATEWRANAQLAWIGGGESRNATDEFTNGSNVTLPPDPSVGNGRAVVWGYGFVDPATGDGMLVAVAAHNRTVVATEHEDEDENETHPPVQSAIDSDRVAALARANASFAAAAANVTDPMYLTFLGSGEESLVAERNGTQGPVWTFVVFGEGGAAIAVVDAANGELLYAGPVPGFGNFRLFEPKVTLHQDSEQGMLTLAQPEASVTFPVAQEDANARVVACIDKQTPTGEVTFVIEGPDGEVAHEESASAAGATTLHWEEHGLEEGTYTARLSLGPGAVQASWDLRVEVWTGTSWDFVGPFGPMGC